MVKGKFQKSDKVHIYYRRCLIYANETLLLKQIHWNDERNYLVAY